MRSKLAEQCREEVVELCRRMSPAERLQAFVNHSRVLTEIYRAGEAARREHRISRTVAPAQSPPPVFVERDSHDQ